jgi:hypothetical protein
MLKLTVAVLAIALAGTASAAGWRSLRVDGTSEVGFAESLAAFEKKLSPSRRYALTLALQEIWLQGTRKASAEQRTYTTSEYFQQLDGLTYDEVVRVPDPTGKAENRYRAEYYAGYRLENGVPQQPFNRPLGFVQQNPPREAGQSRFRPMGGEPGINPWQNR